MTGCTLIPATRYSTLRQQDGVKCALYQFDRSVRDQKLMMRDLENYGDQYHYCLDLKWKSPISFFETTFNLLE